MVSGQLSQVMAGHAAKVASAVVEMCSPPEGARRALEPRLVQADTQSGAHSQTLHTVDRLPSHLAAAQQQAWWVRASTMHCTSAEFNWMTIVDSLRTKPERLMGRSTRYATDE